MAPKKANIRSTTEAHIAALKHVVFQAAIHDAFCKRLIAHLIDESVLLTKPVCITIREGKLFRRPEIRQIAQAFEACIDSRGSVHLNAVLRQMNADFILSHKYGHVTKKGNFDNSGDPSLPRTPVVREHMRYTFWLAKKPHDIVCSRIPISRKRIETIDIGLPGLSHELEHHSQTC